jgi:hypothetical protein
VIILIPGIVNEIGGRGEQESQWQLEGENPADIAHLISSYTNQNINELRSISSFAAVPLLPAISLRMAGYVVPL